VITPKNAGTNKCMYIHGGGFVLQITSAHWKFIKRLMMETNSTIYVPNYPLATQIYSSAKDATAMLIETYKVMLKDSSSSNIHIIGDSAGGTLALVLGQQAKIHELPPPKNLIAFSPALDLNIDGPKAKEMSKHDAVLGAGLLESVGR
jgi:acetyl esterase/lipase